MGSGARCGFLAWVATWFVLPDLLHVWHLGIGRDVVAGCLLNLLRKRGPEAYFRGGELAAEDG